MVEEGNGLSLGRACLLSSFVCAITPTVARQAEDGIRDTRVVLGMREKIGKAACSEMV